MKLEIRLVVAQHLADGVPFETGEQVDAEIDGERVGATRKHVDGNGAVVIIDDANC